MFHNPSVSVSETSIEANTRKYIIRLYTLDRSIQKTFSTRPKLTEALAKAQQYGLPGTKLLLADDGCEICDDEAFLYYIERHAKFMAVSVSSQWMPPNA